MRKLRIKEVYNSLLERLDFVFRHKDRSLEGDCWLDIDSWQFLGINQIINYLTYFIFYCCCILFSQDTDFLVKGARKLVGRPNQT